MIHSIIKHYNDFPTVGQDSNSPSIFLETSPAAAERHQSTTQPNFSLEFSFVSTSAKDKSISSFVSNHSWIVPFLSPFG
jgi:hypothetical protein